MERTRIYRALQGVRGRKPVDRTALERIIVRFGEMIVENRCIKEMDINPLLVSEEGILALDARVALHPPEVREEEWPRLAIRPYPIQYVAPFVMRDGKTIAIRPIRPEDEPLMVKFHATLSTESVYLRYFHVVNLSQRTAHERLTRICFNDYDRELALVAEGVEEGTGEPEILAVGRISKRHGAPEAEFSMLVNDRYQRQGLGSEILRRLIQIAREEGLQRITAEILPDNFGMQRLCERLGFALERRDDIICATQNL
jgi:acetyltransferase